MAVLVLSDLHIIGHAKTNRFNYDKELSVVYHKIVELIALHKEAGCEVFVVFLGDIFHKSYKAPEKYGIDSSFFVKLHNMAKLFVCVGNHELNYYLNNPFWTLVSEIRSERLCKLDKVNTQPLGYEDVFYVVDTVTIGDCTLHFNHYGCVDSPPVEGTTNIAFYHKPVYDRSMVDDARERGIPAEYARESRHSPVEVVCKYDYAFLGHMHWLYGKWKSGSTMLYGLASLGRPNKSEVDNTYLERNIPVIMIEDNKLTRIEDNLFSLPTREDSVIAEKDEEQKLAYEVKKRQEEAKLYVSATDDPVHNIRTYLAAQPELLVLFESIVDHSFSKKEYINQILELERKMEI